MQPKVLSMHATVRPGTRHLACLRIMKLPHPWYVTELATLIWSDDSDGLLFGKPSLPDAVTFCTETVISFAFVAADADVEQPGSPHQVDRHCRSANSELSRSLL